MVDTNTAEEQARIDADPKIRELKEKIEQAKLREQISTAAAKTPAGAIADATKVTEKDTRNPLPALRTFESDAKEFIHDKKESQVSMKIAETMRASGVKTLGTAGRALSVYISVILIVAGVSALALIYYWGTHREPPPVVNQLPTLINANRRVSINISGKNRAGIIASLLSENAGATTTIVAFNLNRGGADSIDSAQMFSLIAPQAPPSLVRSLSNLFEIGFSGGGIPSPFIILGVNSYDNAYAGMLSWENSMPKDLAGFITLNTEPGNWSDKVVKNKDTRIWRNETGNSLIYSFVDKNTLVITSDEATFLLRVDLCRVIGNIAQKYANLLRTEVPK